MLPPGELGCRKTQTRAMPGCSAGTGACEAVPAGCAAQPASTSKAEAEAHG